jgi:regulator of sirC expression with transglutaminase-like and TPR domain
MKKEKISAIIELLKDPSLEVQSLMKEQLKKLNAVDLATLSEEISRDNRELAFHIDVLVQEKEYESFIKDLEDIITSGNFDIEIMVFFLARFINPAVDEAALTESLNILAEGCKAYLEDHKDLSRGDGLAEFLGGKCKFDGNKENYYAIGNSSIECILDTHKGLPISLSVLYVLVGKRLGIPVKGVALPGHFIVGVFEESGDAFYDPFNNGKKLTVDECQLMTRRSGYSFSDDFLDPTEDNVIFFRMLNNLKYVYSRENKDDEEGFITHLMKIWTEKVFRQIG